MKTIQVSDLTRTYIRCMEELNIVQQSICDALIQHYGIEQAEEIIDGEYYEVCSAMDSLVEKYLCLSIREHMGYNCETTLI